MCSIFCCTGKNVSRKEMERCFYRALSRGPDMTALEETPGGFMGFHRLAIMGLNAAGMQPFTLNGSMLVCNGEIYGFRSWKRVLEGKGYVKAKELTKEDRLRHSDGSEGRIERIEIEQLKKAETKYNFEVEDFHTYYVTDKDVLVHNECKPISPKKLTRSEIKKFDAEGYKKLYVGKNGARFDIYKDTANADKIWLGDKSQKIWIETFETLSDLFSGGW